MSSLHRYRSFGFTFASEIELPGVTLACADARPSATIRWGATPDRLRDAVDGAACHGLAYEARPGEILITVDEVGRFLVRDGKQVVVEPEPLVTQAELRVYLMGSVFGSLLHQRGLTPLHASAIRVGDGSVAFCGPSGAGKSTLAAFLREAGYDVITDDLCPITISSREGPLAWPGFPRMKVWSDALAALQIAPESVSRVYNRCDKFELPAPRRADEPLPLRRLYVLACPAVPAAAPSIELLDEGRALEALVKNTYRLEYLKGFRLREQHFQACVAAVRQLPVYRLTRTWDLSCIEATLACLREDFRQICWKPAAVECGA